MTRCITLAASLLLAMAMAAPAAAQTHTELDAFWAEVSRTVAEGDYEGYAATYHPDAVLVSGPGRQSYPIAQALARWKQGFDDTRAGKMAAGVDFRLTQRLNDATTAHETGIFRYFSQPDGGDREVALVHFEALLVKQNGEWKMVMEYQKEAATQAEWEAARSATSHSGMSQ